MKKKLIKFLVLNTVIGLLVIAGYIVILSVKSSNQMLHPVHLPITLMPEEFGITDYHDVQLQTPDGITLSGWYIPPASDNHAVIILAHGYAHNRQMLLPEAAILIEHGYGVLLFDFRGHGESDNAMVTLGDTEQIDIQAAVSFVANQENVEHIGAIGFSMGAAAISGAASNEDRIEAVVLEASFSTLKDEIFYRARFFGPLSQVSTYLTIWKAGVDYDNVVPIEQLCKITPRPVFIIYGKQDDLVKNGTAEEMSSAACEPFDFWIVEGAGHQNYAPIVKEEYRKRIATFFDLAFMHE